MAGLIGSPDAEIVGDDAEIEIAHVQTIERLVRHRLDRATYARRLGGEAAKKAGQQVNQAVIRDGDPAIPIGGCRVE